MPEFAAARALRTDPPHGIATILAEVSDAAVLRGKLRSRRMEALALNAHLINLADEVEPGSSAAANVARARDYVEAALAELSGALLKLAEDPRP